MSFPRQDRTLNREYAKVYFDKAYNRLVYIGRPADEEFWDRQWAESIDEKAIKRADPFVVNWTARYLGKGSHILDAGCGLANTVWGLKEAGFNAFGIDYAPKTVEIINRLAPDLNVQRADVRQLPFPDGHFDGIWSLGVIEHFIEGYRDILDETARVLKPGGLVFVTVPSVSPLRRVKVTLGAYPEFDGDFTDFYQFVMSPRVVREAFADAGWKYVGGASRGGFKGLKDESGPLRPMLQSLYDKKSKTARFMRAGLNRLLAPVSFHTRLYIFARG